MEKIFCPVCGEDLKLQNGSCICINNHCFDMAKQGYVNLLVNMHKDGSLTGDNKDMAKSRRSFLEKGYFDALSEALCCFIMKEQKSSCPVITDICCGEGYYGDYIKKRIGCEMYGFDLSKEMVKLAASRKNGCFYFVANLSKIPLKNSCCDFALHLFAPFHEKEFSRILADNGCLISVIPGENHLFELKEILYDTPYKNDEKSPDTYTLYLADKIKISRKVTLTGNDDIMTLFKMTPYYYRTKKEDKEKLSGLENLEVTTEFVLLIYKKAAAEE